MPEPDSCGVHFFECFAADFGEADTEQVQRGANRKNKSVEQEIAENAEALAKREYLTLLDVLRKGFFSDH
jgi:hypothetical protein